MENISLLNESPIVFEKCLDSLDEFNSTYRSADTLPYFAVKAKFEYCVNYTGGRDYELPENISSEEKDIASCWMIGFLWEYSGWGYLIHVMNFVVSCEDYSVLCWDRCM